MLKQRKNNGFVLVEAIFALFLATVTITLIGYVMINGLQNKHQSGCWLNKAATNLMDLHRISYNKIQPQSSEKMKFQIEALNENIPLKVSITCGQIQEVIEIETIQMQEARFSLE